MSNKPLELADTSDGAVTHAVYNQVKKEIEAAGIDTYITRASSAGKCSRQLWYKRNGAKPDKAMEPRTRHLFRSGHISEIVLLNDLLESAVGPGRPWAELNCGEIDSVIEIGGVEYKTFKQLEWSFTLPNGEVVTGHPDAVAKLHNGEYELIDAKTFSNFGFMRFEKKETPAIEAVEDYKFQAHALMNCDEARDLNIKRFRFVGIKKDTSHMADRLIDLDSGVLDVVIRRYMEALSEKKPERTHSPENEMTGRSPNKRPTGRKVLGWRCSYCPYADQCWGKLTVEFKSGRPIYIVEKETKNAI